MPNLEVALGDDELDELIERIDGIVAAALRRAVKAGTSQALTAAGVEGPPQIDSTNGEPHTGAMIALVPSNASEWALASGEPADSLHVTLAYLGDSTDIVPSARDALDQALMTISDLFTPVTGKVFGASIWNVDSDSPSLNLSVGGEDVDLIHMTTWFALETYLSEEAPLPDQHQPWVAHMCLAYGDVDELKNKFDDALMQEGEITFDRIRLGLGGESIDYVLGGEK